MAKQLVVAGVLAAACGGPAKQPAPAPIHMSAQGVGSITAQTPATVDGVRAALPGYDVKQIDTPDGPEIHVAQRGEDLFYVVPQTDGHHILNVHVTSARVTFGENGWQIGAAFKSGSLLTKCDCWGPHPDRPGHSVCYRKGDHVAVGFDRECRDEYEDLPAVVADLAGKPIKLLVWSPSAFGDEKHAPPVEDATPP